MSERRRVIQMRESLSLGEHEEPGTNEPVNFYLSYSYFVLVSGFAQALS